MYPFRVGYWGLGKGSGYLGVLYCCVDPLEDLLDWSTVPFC